MVPKRRVDALTQAQLARFWPKVRIGTPDECWPFQSSRTQTYGQFQHCIASRVAYYLHYGADPGDKLVCHTCDNPPCCNPAHLFLGDYRTNKHDCMDKGRHAKGKMVTRNRAPMTGENNPRRRYPDRYANVKLIGAYWRDPETAFIGERNGRAKLTAPQVLNIRQRLAEGATYSALAGEYGVSKSAIKHIRSGKNWKHLA